MLEEMADSESSMVQLTGTSLTYQPVFPSMPLTDGAMTGGVLSPASYQQQGQLYEAIAVLEEAAQQKAREKNREEKLEY